MILSKKSTNLAVLFREQFVIFLDELIEQFPQEADIVIVRLFFKDQIPLTTVMDYIVKWLLPCVEKIKNRDEDFFLKNEELFSGISNNKVLHIKKIWESESLNNEDKDVIWDWFDAFSDICVKYQKSIDE